MKKLKIVLKNGEVKKYPWDNIYFAVSDENVIVTRKNPARTFIFRAPASNIEYCEAIEEEEEKEADGCKGCKHVGLWENEYENGLSCPCLRCSRRTPDNYEPERRNDD